MAATAGRGEDIRVAVLGTGIMGAAMARNLVSAGLRTTVWDRSPAATAPLSDAGALVAASAAEAVAEAQVVITMLPTADVVSSVAFGAGVAQALAHGAVWAQMGTIGLDATAQIGRRLGELRPDVLFVDAPVSGSKGPAQAGQLLILASGPPAAAQAADPVFAAIGRKTVWLGEAGQGSAMKLAVNAYMSILIEGVAEALELAGRLGIDDAKLAECIEGGPAAPPATGSCRSWRRCPASGAPRLTPATAGRTSALPAWPWAAAPDRARRRPARARRRPARAGPAQAPDRRMRAMDASATAARPTAQPRVARNTPNACELNPTTMTGTVSPT
jgi:3-hydroxyisobutyrate dehydrogenase